MYGGNSYAGNVYINFNCSVVCFRFPCFLEQTILSIIIDYFDLHTSVRKNVCNIIFKKRSTQKNAIPNIQTFYLKISFVLNNSKPDDKKRKQQNLYFSINLSLNYCQQTIHEPSSATVKQRLLFERNKKH